jgi:IrrE N-terminal-like domain
MSATYSPKRWGNELTRLLNAVYAASPVRFPVRVPALAKEFSAQRFPNDAIVMVKGESLDNFDGALLHGAKGWGIVYNNAITSAGRINFTLAHEFGHYLLHRIAFPDGLQCGQQDMVRWDSAYRQIESQANDFAATLLMPLDDFRKQIDARGKPNLDDIGACAERYGVSLIAAALRWLEYTERRAVLVVSRDGFILWSRSSDRALRTGAFFRTANVPPVPIPSGSLPAQPDLLEKSKGQVRHEADVWFREPCDEIALVSDHYDFAISLLHLEAAEWTQRLDEEEDEDAFDVMARRIGGRA